MVETAGDMADTIMEKVTNAGMGIVWTDQYNQIL